MHRRPFPSWDFHNNSLNCIFPFTPTTLYINCSSFSCCILSPPLHFTNVITSHLVIYPLCSNTALLRDIPYALLYSCAFLYKKCTGLSSCCAFCRLATHTTSSSLFLFFSTSIFGYSYLKCPTPTSKAFNLFYYLISPYPYFSAHKRVVLI